MPVPRLCYLEMLSKAFQGIFRSERLFIAAIPNAIPNELVVFTAIYSG